MGSEMCIRDRVEGMRRMKAWEDRLRKAVPGTLVVIRGLDARSAQGKRTEAEVNERLQRNVPDDIAILVDWKGDFVQSLPDAAIDTHIAQAAVAPSELSLMHLYPIDGAVRRVPKDATAWSARDATWSMVIAGISADPSQAEDLKTWGRAYWQAIHPFNLEGAYVNFMMDDEAQGRVQATYGENYPRLAAVKAAYDPENLFRVNQNILPAAAR